MRRQWSEDRSGLGTVEGLYLLVRTRSRLRSWESRRWEDKTIEEVKEPRGQGIGRINHVGPE